jgi:hypothetical protein
MNPKAGGILAAILLSATIITWPGAHAATPATHQHEQGVRVHGLKLNAGQKWATDEPLRQGMSRIKDALEPRLPAVHGGKLSAAQYDALGKEIDAQLAYVVQNCKLEPQADAVLHVILADLIAGNDALQGKNKKLKRSAGVVKVVQSLENYGKYFDHPGWRAPKAGH